MLTRRSFKGHLTQWCHPALVSPNKLIIAKGSHELCVSHRFDFSVILVTPQLTSEGGTRAVTLVSERWEALAAHGRKQQIAAHQHSSKEAGAWLLRYGLLVYSCLRTELSTWSSMPIRQAELLKLLTAGSLPATQCNSSPLHTCAKALSLLHLSLFAPKGPNPVWSRCVPLRGWGWGGGGDSSQHLAAACGLSDRRFSGLGRRAMQNNLCFFWAKTNYMLFPCKQNYRSM